MPSWAQVLRTIELFVLRHPIFTVLILLVTSTVIAAAIPAGDPNVGATIWLVTGGGAMIWRWTVLKDKHPGVSAAPGLFGLVRGWWRRLTRRDKPSD